MATPNEIVPPLLDNAPQPIAQDRITVSGGIYHQTPGEQASEIPIRYSRWLAGSEQPYTRRCQVGESWAEVDTGWIEHAGLIALTNKEGQALQVNPTEKERATTQAKIVEVCVDVGDHTMHDPPHKAQWLVLPGESFYGTPTKNAKLLVRCQSGEARLTVHAVSG